MAELIGIVFGDGAIGNPWQVVISLNSISDKSYSIYISKLFYELFRVNVKVRKRPNQNTLVVVCSSITIVDYLVGHGATRGSKIKNGLVIPSWIKNNNGYQKALVRGLVDTDGCIYFHNHFTNKKRYVNIGLCFTNYSTEFIKTVDEILKNNGINSHISGKGKRIYLYGSDNIEEYLRIFGSSNSRITDKYSKWRDARVV